MDSQKPRETMRMQFEDASGCHSGRVFKDDYFQMQLDGGCDLHRFLEMVDAAGIKLSASEIAAEELYKKKAIALAAMREAGRLRHEAANKELKDRELKALSIRLAAEATEKAIVEAENARIAETIERERQENKDRYQAKRLLAEEAERQRLIDAGTVADARPDPMALIGVVWQAIRQRFSSTA